MFAFTHRFDVSFVKFKIFFVRFFSDKVCEAVYETGISLVAGDILPFLTETRINRNEKLMKKAKGQCISWQHHNQTDPQTEDNCQSSNLGPYFFLVADMLDKEPHTPLLPLLQFPENRTPFQTS